MRSQSDLFGRNANSCIKGKAFFYPVIKKGIGLFWFAKPFQLHLLKFTHTKQKLFGSNFIAKSFANLCDVKKNFDTIGRINIFKINKNSLRGFRPQICNGAVINGGTQLCLKHHVKLADLCPCFVATMWAWFF